jgi:hypothetical protein
LVAALGLYGSVLHLTAARVDECLGKKGIACAHDGEAVHLRLVPWLIEQESKHRFVVYETDPQWSGWSDGAVRNADHILVVADAQAPPGGHEAQERLKSRFLQSRAPQRTLVLLQPQGREAFPGTGRWLDAWRVDGHFHVRRGSTADVARVAQMLTYQ